MKEGAVVHMVVMPKTKRQERSTCFFAEDRVAYRDPFHGAVVQEKLYGLFVDGLLCDVTLCTADGDEVKAHKSVLAANSDYFSRMFTGSMKESCLGKVCIHDVSFDVLKSLVSFCYTSSVEIRNDNALELLSAANMLQFHNIKATCSTYLLSKLDSRNCFVLERFADLHDCTNLKEKADEFAREHFRYVIQTDEFLEIPLEKLVALLRSDSICLNSEREVFSAALKWVQHAPDRRKYMADLLALVRLTLIPPKILVDCIESEPIVHQDPRCLQLINEAKTYHLVPSHDSSRAINAVPRLLAGNQHIYLVGGETRTKVFASMHRFSLRDHKWRQLSSMKTPRDGLGIAAYDGKIFVSGGYDGSKAVGTSEVYSLDTDTWTSVSDMHHPRHAFSMVEFQGWIYAAGGSDFDSTEYNSVERYDPVRDNWCKVANMMSKREGLVLTHQDDTLFALGGENGVSILNTVERFDPRTGIWYVCAPMGYRRRYFGAGLLNGKIYCVGGSDYEEDLSTVECFDSRANRWLPIPSMSKRRESVAVVCTEGKLFAMGGACKNKEMDSVEVYDPILNKWDMFAPLPHAKEGMAAIIV